MHGVQLNMNNAHELQYFSYIKWTTIRLPQSLTAMRNLFVRMVRIEFHCALLDELSQIDDYFWIRMRLHSFEFESVASLKYLSRT